MASRIKVVFLNRHSRRDMGSSVMRVDQLSQHLSRYFGDRYDVSIQYVSNKVKPLQRALLNLRNRDTVYVFSKYAAWGWRPQDMQALQACARGILVDYVDMPISEMIADGVDCHIASSFGGVDMQREWVAQQTQAGRVISGQHMAVLHNYDTALDAIAPGARPDDLNIAYFGSRHLFPHSPLADQRVDFLDGGMPEAFQENLTKIGKYHAQMCIRIGEKADGAWVAKPVTKLVTAAVSDAVILTDRKSLDVERLLGADYPFLTPDGEPASIDAGLERLQAGFGGPEWLLAQERVRALRDMFSHRAIATQLDQAIQTCL